MFNECESLISLPDISQWNTSNVTDMSYMFDGCINCLNIISKFIIYFYTFKFIQFLFNYFTNNYLP